MATVDIKGEVQGVKTEVAKLNWTVGIVSIALLVALVSVIIGYVGMIQDSDRFKAETYQVLVDKVNTLIDQNNQTSKNEKDQEIQDLKDQIVKLKKDNYLK